MDDIEYDAVTEDRRWKIQIKGPTEWVVWGYGPEAQNHGLARVEPARLVLSQASAATGRELGIRFTLPVRESTENDRPQEYRRVTGLAWRFAQGDLGTKTDWQLVASETEALQQAEAYLQHVGRIDTQEKMRGALSRVQRIAR